MSQFSLLNDALDEETRRVFGRPIMRIWRDNPARAELRWQIILSSGDAHTSYEAMSGMTMPAATGAVLGQIYEGSFGEAALRALLEAVKKCPSIVLAPG